MRNRWKKILKRNNKKISYLCDGKVRDCSKTNCYIYGGGCHHTTNVKHARNFHIGLLGDFREKIPEVPEERKGTTGM